MKPAKPTKLHKPAHIGPHATYPCKDCGVYGCLIPVTHKLK